MEEQKRLMQEIQSGSFGMSMYDRVKRRSVAPKPDEQKKKSQALERIREKSSKKVFVLFVGKNEG